MSEQHQPADAAAIWDDVYRDGRKWSGEPNAFLVSEIGDGPAPEGATALDLGCGEGGDAIWLATLGWDVLAVDVSAIALERARVHAEERAVAVRFQRSDLDATFPEGTFDLVTASYLHSPIALQRDAILRRAWDAVAPGGRLVVLSHADVPSGAHAHPEMEVLGPAETLLRLELPVDAGWRASVHYATRPLTLPDGSASRRTDHVVVVSRS